MIKKAVWSHWSKPFKKNTTWSDKKYLLLSCALSLETARQHYPETILITDDEGVKMLVDKMGLPYTHVSTELNALNECSIDLWNMGKLYAYRAQTEPFLHLDQDVYLWKPLPDKLSNAAVFAQNPEHFTEDSDYYLPAEFENAINDDGGWLPDEWKWCRSIFGDFQKSINTGIFGGNNLEFIQYAVNLTIATIEHQNNAKALSSIGHPEKVVGMLEQFIPAACLDYHCDRKDSPFSNIKVECLFESAEEAYEKANQLGYTHLIGPSKKSQELIALLEKRVKEYYPQYYERCVI